MRLLREALGAGVCLCSVRVSWMRLHMGNNVDAFTVTAVVVGPVSQAWLPALIPALCSGAALPADRR